MRITINVQQEAEGPTGVVTITTSSDLQEIINLRSDRLTGFEMKLLTLLLSEVADRQNKDVQAALDKLVEDLNVKAKEQ